MSKKVLGFKNDLKELIKDFFEDFIETDEGNEFCSHFALYLEEFGRRKQKLVPVVSLQEHNEKIEKLRKHLDAVIAFREKKFVPLQAIKEWVEKNKFGYNPPRVNVKELIKFIEDRGGENKK